jgi:hypothetical protein
MAALTVENIGLAGIEPTLVAAAGGGDTFSNDGVATFLVVDNASGGAIVLTFDDTGSVSPLAAKTFDADVEVSVGAGAVAYIGPFALSRFTKTVAISYSGVTSLTVGALRLTS